ncbi:MAG TPA: hypothetical protein DCQ33_04850 [Nitrospira sp.]|nr:hypothetical protein [Nitrospira sp.]
MRKKSASGVLASFSASPYCTGTIRRFTRCGLAGRTFCASWELAVTMRSRDRRSVLRRRRIRRP